MKNRLPWLLLAVLTAAAVVDSFWLNVLQRDLESFASYCHLAPGLDCAPALKSRYGKFFGMPLSSFAIATYLVFFALAVQPFFNPKRTDRNALALLLFSGGGSLFCAWLVYISYFRLKAYCPYCLVLHVLTPLILLAAWWAFRGRTASVRSIVKDELATISGDRRILAGSILALLLLAVGVPALHHVRRRQLLDSEPNLRAYLQGDYPRLEGFSEIIGDRPFKGDSDAAVTIVEFADFMCPICRETYELMDEMLQAYDVKLVFIPHPRSVECNPAAEQEVPGSCLGALVAQYAAPRGKLWDVYEAVFSDDTLLREDRSAELAALAGAPSVDAIRTDTAAADAFRRDMFLATQVGVRHTPSFFINGMGFEGLPEDWFLQEVIEREEERAR